MRIALLIQLFRPNQSSQRRGNHARATLFLTVPCVHASGVVLFLVNFATVFNKNLGLFLLSSVRVERHIDLAALRAFL